MMIQENLNKTPSASETIKTEIVCPNDTNPMGILKGGRLVEWMDIAAAVSAQLHAEMICVTASMHQVDFIKSAHVGDIIFIMAKVTRTFNTSLEVYTNAYTKNIHGGEKTLLTEAYFTFVGLNVNEKSTIIQPIFPETEKEKIRYESALSRRKKPEKIGAD